MTRLIIDGLDRRGVRAGRAPDRRRVSRLAAVATRPTRAALAALAPGLTPEMAAAGQQDDAQSGSHRGRRQVPGRDRVSQHHRPARPAVGAAAAQPSHRRSRGRRRQRRRRPDAGRRRRGDRRQSGDRQPAALRRRCLRCSTTCVCALEIPTQTCVLTHVTTTIELIGARRAGRSRVPVDRAAPRRPTAVSASTSRCCGEAREAALSLGAARVGDNVMYFETGQGSALSADAHHGVDQQTMEARAYAVARAVRAAAGQYGRRLHRPGISLRRQADHPRRARGPFLRQAARPADGLRRLLHQPRRGRSGRHGRAADRCSAPPA